jgi:hypothetical protein
MSFSTFRIDTILMKKVLAKRTVFGLLFDALLAKIGGH